jgi:hypothetical protein
LEKHPNDTAHDYALDLTNSKTHIMANGFRRSSREREEEVIDQVFRNSRVVISKNFRICIRTFVEDPIDEFDGGEHNSRIPEAVPLEKRIEGILSVDDKVKECQMEEGDVNGFECLPRINEFRAVSPTSWNPPVFGGSILRWFKALQGFGT